MNWASRPSSTETAPEGDPYDQPALFRRLLRRPTTTATPPSANSPSPERSRSPAATTHPHPLLEPGARAFSTPESALPGVPASLPSEPELLPELEPPLDPPLEPELPPELDPLLDPELVPLLDPELLPELDPLELPELELDEPLQYPLAGFDVAPPLIQAAGL